MKPCPRCGEWTDERSRFCPGCGAPLAEVPVAGERRKVVTTIFADVVGSTALGERVDPETLRWAMQRWFLHMRRIVERHGGTVENYRGDAVMAVFGIPAAHEDDALRAVRAAVEMRDAGAALRGELREARHVDLAARIGVNTGEAVTGASPGGGSFTAGDAVNVAARLEQSAPPGEILLGRETYRLVAHAVEAAPLEPLALKGKAAAVEAFRLVRVASHARSRPQRPPAPLVGRAAEREELLAAFAGTVASGSCRARTVVGAPGVGKTRLVAEVVEALSGRATVASGRCLPYGDALTWWPLAEALGSSGLFASVSARGHPAFGRVAELLDPAGEPVAPEEAIWAVRVVLEALAAERPLVLVVDDLHWAAPTFLDLWEHLAGSLRDAPVLLLATARPELLDLRPGWPGAVPLDRLGDAEAADLLHQLVSRAPLQAGADQRILAAAEGNPLFVVEFAAMLGDDPAAWVSVPPTIHALLTARLDSLGPDERAVLEAAAIEGKVFDRDRALALLDDQERESFDAALEGLARKRLIERDGTRARVLRFHHQLIRDTAYDAMPKQLRADRHARFAAGLEAREPVSATREEMIGHHRERAVLLRRELGEADAATADLAARAARSLGTAARSAAQREDPSSAVALLERATALVASDAGTRSALLPSLGASLFEAGRIPEATSVLDEAVALAPDVRARARAGVEREFVRLETESGAGNARALHVAEAVLPILEHAGDDLGQCRAWSLRAQATWLAGHVEAADAAWEQAAACAERAGDERELFWALGCRAMAAVWGPTPVPEAIRRCEGFRERVQASPVAVASIDNPLATLHAMNGDFDLAERHLAAARRMREQLGSLGWAVSHFEAMVRMLTGQPELAEQHLRVGIETLSGMHDGGLLATAAAMHARALLALGRLTDAAAQCRLAARAGAADDIVTHAIRRGVEAQILAVEGEWDEAEAVARAAVALLEPTDLLSHRGDAMLDCAEVLRARPGRPYQAAARDALAEYEHKGNAVGAARARALNGRHREE